MTINDLKTGMIVQLGYDSNSYYVVYKDAVPMYSTNPISSDTYLVDMLNEEFWSSAITSVPSYTHLESTNIDKVWKPKYPHYTGQKAINAIQNTEPIWTRKEELTEMTLEQICEALGKNIKIIKG